jgi:SNF2 family DNA or RNA helicase
LQGKDGWQVYCSLDHAGQVAAPQAPPPPVRRELTAAGEIYVPYEPHNLAVYRSFPGAMFTAGADGKCWKVSLEPRHRRRVLELADQVGLAVAPQLREVAESPAAALARAKGAYEFQVEGVDWLSAQKKALLGDEMGLGKTAQTALSLRPDEAALVVCPASLKLNWQKEVRQWRPDLACYVVNGKHMFALPNPGEVIVCNYEMLPDELKKVAVTGPDGKPVKNERGYDLKEVRLPADVLERLARTTVIVDEAHRVSNYKSGVSQKMDTLAHQGRRVIGLTGTPLLNRPQQLKDLLMHLGLFGEVFGSVARFRRLFNAYQEKVSGGKKVWVYGTPQPEVPGLLRRVMLRRERAVVLPDLPSKSYQTRLVALPDRLRRTMDAAWDECREALDALTVGAEMPKFEQISAVRRELASARIPDVLDFVETAEDANVPLVVASAHREPIDALAGRPGWGVITGDTPNADRQRLVDEFQAGRLKGFGLTIRAGGVGITLTRAWQMLFVDREWTPALNDQCEDRICRIGQTAAGLLYTQMTTDHPLELRLNALLGYKQGLIRAAVTQDVVVCTIWSVRFGECKLLGNKLLARHASYTNVLRQWLPKRN